MSFKVITLGSGVCANRCIPGPRRYPPGFLVDYQGKLLLLDVSEGARFRLDDEGYDYGDVACAALSHVHPDHAALEPFLQARLCRALWGKATPESPNLRVFMHETSVPGFEQAWNWHHPEAGGKLNHFPDKFQFQVLPIRGGWEEEIFPGLRLKAFGVYHGFGQHPAMGFRLQTKDLTVVYTGDCGLTDSLFKEVEKADLLIADAGVNIGQDYTGGYGHMTPKQDGLLAYRGQVKELWLTHYVGLDTSAAMEADARLEGFTGTVKVATDGLRWEKA